MGTLFIVATPIGNLEDITLRAVRVLREVELVAAEDTRKTRVLLERYQVKKPITSYFEHNKLAKLDYILTKLDEGDVALVSDAGMPGLSDPGYELIREAIKKGITVVPLPGPSSILTALVVSGLPTDRFFYQGFLPSKSGERRRALQGISELDSTLVILESPHRLTDTLADVLSILGDRSIAVCRELTKIHEEIFRGNVSEAIAHFSGPRGEFVLVIEGNKFSEDEGSRLPAAVVKLGRLKAAGMPAREAVVLVTGETGLSRRKLYSEWVKLQ